MDCLRPSLHPLTPIQSTSTQTLPSPKNPPPVCAPVPSNPIAFEEDSEMSLPEGEPDPWTLTLRRSGGLTLTMTG